MAHKYAQIAFTDTVREVQTELNSRAGYAGIGSRRRLQFFNV